MSLSISFSGPDGEDGPFQLASASGWTAFAGWAGTGSKAWAELVEKGQYKGTNALSSSLRRKIAADPPNNPDVLHTAQQLLDVMGVGDAQETATVTS